MPKELKQCPISKAAKLLGDIWVILIVKELLNGTKRFNQLQNALLPPSSQTCISSKTLTERLKMLENEGVVDRKVFAQIPPKVEYSLTKKGMAISQIIQDLKSFGEIYLDN